AFPQLKGLSQSVHSLIETFPALRALGTITTPLIFTFQSHERDPSPRRSARSRVRLRPLVTATIRRAWAWARERPRDAILDQPVTSVLGQFPPADASAPGFGDLKALGC